MNNPDVTDSSEVTTVSTSASGSDDGVAAAAVVTLSLYVAAFMLLLNVNTALAFAWLCWRIGHGIGEAYKK